MPDALSRFGLPRQTPAEELKQVISIEERLSLYYHNLASLINNGGVKQKCFFFSLEDTGIKVKLLERFNNLRMEDTMLEDMNLRYAVNPEDFSLIGMIDIGLEINAQAIRAYKNLLKSAKDGEKILFRELLKTKLRERKFLEKEKMFHENIKITVFCRESLYYHDIYMVLPDWRYE